jgi:Fibronectin type III domain
MGSLIGNHNIAVHSARSKRTTLLTGGLVLLFCCLWQIQARAQNDVTLAWDPSGGPALAGYRLYSGTASGVYTQTIEVGNTTSALVSNLTAGTTYYFTVTAYDTSGHESLPSNEVSYMVSQPGHLGNISTRLNVGVDDDVLIGGFIVRGPVPKRMILRAIGPSLTGAGVIGAMANPTLELHDSTGATIATNDNWQTSAQASEISASGLAPRNPLESAIIATLQPGSYTAIVRGVNNTTGIALVEGYELDSTTTRLMNISARGHVGVGNDVLIGGFIVTGSQSKTVMVRALGPSLGTGAHPLAGVLVNPVLELHDGSGNLLSSNDDWVNSPQHVAIVASGLAPSHSLESAILTTLSPGNYTAIVRGVHNTTGIGLVEVYDLDPVPTH